MKTPSLKILAALALAGSLPLLQPATSRAADDKKPLECTMAADGKLTTADGKAMDNCVLMKDGKMHMYHDGKLMAMNHEMTMADGSKCLPDGTCVMKDGTKRKFRDGDVVDHVGQWYHTKGLRAPDGTYR